MYTETGKIVLFRCSNYCNVVRTLFTRFKENPTILTLKQAVIGFKEDAGISLRQLYTFK